ncbi:MAG TPA: bile acid:sodium symporter family protein [Anaerolineales bacterium]|nr:bile acid:sodium symporter family protein [Anaerolineales bacterium]HNQ95175.1 bile acid:sodium symporter family protein [Anaerolineales bacterium]HNS61025.1 bile acid:sodium symporter family protein [Anaerolineales bacterium]
MQESVISTVILPLAIFIIMVTLGMTLTVADFRRIVTQPKPVFIGLFCQMILLPLLGFAVAGVFGLTAVYAISLILLAVSPDGATSNLIIHAGDGDRALGITLTAITNMLAFLTIPFGLGIAYSMYGTGALDIDFPVADTMIQVAVITVIPTLLGMWIRVWKPEFAENSKRWSKTFATVFLFLVIIALIIQNWDVIVRDGPRFAPAFIVLNILSLIVGYFVPKLLGIDYVQSMTIAIETGLQNSTVSITVALTLLNNNDMAIIPGLYAIWMYVTGFALAFWMARRNPVAVQTPTA